MIDLNDSITKWVFSDMGKSLVNSNMYPCIIQVLIHTPKAFKDRAGRFMAYLGKLLYLWNYTSLYKK